MIILGLDISSSAIGCAVLDCQSGQIPILKYSSFIVPRKKGTIFERLLSIEADIKDLLTTYKPDLVGIEDIAKYFPGKSSANTILTLGIFNRTIGLQCVRDGFRVELYNVLAIRHGIKLTKKLPSKEEMPNVVSTILSIPFPWIMSTKGKNKGKPVPQNLDMSDAICVALFANKKASK